MKTYRGIPPHGVVVDVDDAGKKGFIGTYTLAPRLDLRNHSPTGFSWGYDGSGPSQLALAICVDCVGRLRALQVYQIFKADVIATFPGDQPWSLTEAQVRKAIEAAEREFAKVAP